MTEQQIISLFTKDTIKEYHIINTSHGDDDFREAIICTFDSGKKLVIKTAHNSFTSVEHIKMWQRCIEEYKKLGYYSPEIFESLNGTFPTVFYKGQECIAYAEEFSIYHSVKDCTNARSYRDNLYLMTAKIAKQQFNYTDFPSAYCLFDIFPGDELDEVTQNALEFQRYCTTLPKCFEPQTIRMFKRWEDNRKQLEKIYFELPFSVFQALFWFLRNPRPMPGFPPLRTNFFKFLCKVVFFLEPGQVVSIAPLKILQVENELQVKIAVRISAEYIEHTLKPQNS